MKADHPLPQNIPGLRALWKEAFGDSDAFLDLFFATAFSPERCFCIGESAALYWFDCSLAGQKLAYIYAVATAKAMRGQGLCRSLMADTHAHLQERGYAAAILVPGSPALRKMYRTMGYQDATCLLEVTCPAGDAPATMREVTAEEYGALRRQLLPAGGVLQEGENLAFAGAMMKLYAGQNWLLAADETLSNAELLGDPGAAPGIVKALGKTAGTFRMPGGRTPFAMTCPLTPNAPNPAYFGLAFD